MSVVGYIVDLNTLIITRIMKEIARITRHFVKAIKLMSYLTMNYLNLYHYLLGNPRGQINNDHKTCWSWCGYLLYSRRYSLFDIDWNQAFASLVNLLLSSNSQFVTGLELSDFESEAQKYVNWHLLQVKYQKHLLTGPLSFALLEGLLRRKIAIMWILMERSLNHSK
jgi:hypothetical protein